MKTTKGDDIPIKMGGVKEKKQKPCLPGSRGHFRKKDKKF